MSDIICTTCKIKAYSKCPNCRNVFFNNQTAGLLSNILAIQLTKKDLKIEISRGQRNGQPLSFREEVEQLAALLNGLLGKPDEKMRTWLDGLTLEQVTCDHTWAWFPGAESSIGCGHTLEPLTDELKKFIEDNAPKVTN